VTAFHRPINDTSPTRHTNHQDSDSENTFSSSSKTQCNGYHLFLRGGVISRWILVATHLFQIPTGSSGKIFSSTHFFVMGTFICNCGFCTYRAILKPYTTSRWILVAAHLFQLDYFESFHVSTSFCTSRALLGL
jgi:hypothetical protein